MRDEYDNRSLIAFDDEDTSGQASRWLPAGVVAGVVASFVTLAWYAYHAGTQSLKDEDLLVVEADKSPIKEKPLDPGGMKFPDQDKTVFETFSSAAPAPAKVERVLPSPEEPAPPIADTSGAPTWINDKLHKNTDADKTASASLEQVIGADAAKQDTPVPEKPKTETLVAQNPTQPQAQPDNNKHMAETDAVVKLAQLAPAAEGEKKAAETPQKQEKKDSAIADDAKTIKVQLSAYRSEKEAKAGWNKMKKAHSDLFAGMSPSIVKADLGAKGIYYRLRIAGFSNSADAKAFCGKLKAKGQSCIVASGK